MSSGWYKRQRNIVERPWFTDAQVLQLYDYLEARAYVSDGTYEGQTIRIGSCPTTRPEMMEATGLSYKQVDRCLRKLIQYGEIIVNGNYRYSVVTICRYGNVEQQLSLFGTTEGTAAGTTEGTAAGTTEGTAHLLTKEYKNIDNLISHSIPYKNEKENRSVALEVKKRYNKSFDGMLPPCSRLSMQAQMSVEECIRRFGMQSIDMVFDQIKNEPFSLGMNKTGFIASFTYIFTPKRFQEYLERYQLRMKKGKSTTAPSETAPIIDEPVTSAKQKAEDYREMMRRYAAEYPNSQAAKVVATWDRENERKNL